MDQDSVKEAISGMDGVAVDEAMNAWFFFYDPEGINPANRMYPFATLVTTDEHDQASDLNRPGVYRLNIGVSRETFRKLFPEDTEHDYTTLDTLLPHPVYAAQSWISVLNPSDETFEKLRPLLAQAHGRAVGKYKKGPG